MIEAPTRDRILLAAEDLLRRHGLAKTNVVDVARLLGMSHANVYRHFASKAALQEAVAERWLHAIAAPLAACAASDAPPAQRLRDWVLMLVAAKRHKVLDDPELFATYQTLAQTARAVVVAHVGELKAQLSHIVADGVAGGAFRVTDPSAAAQVVFTATLRFHHPHFVAETAGDDVALAQMLDMLIAALEAGVV